MSGRVERCDGEFSSDVWQEADWLERSAPAQWPGFGDDPETAEFMVNEQHLATLDAALRGFFAGKKVILFGRPLAQYRGRVELLRGLGVGAVFAVANGPGVGEPPEGLDGYAFMPLGEVHASTYARNTSAALASPTPAVVAALDQFDPDCQAVVLAESNVATDRCLGRKVLDGRRPECAALEDKANVDEMWARLDLSPYLDATVVEAKPGPLGEGQSLLDHGQGVWWIGDMRDGVYGTTEMSRIVSRPEELGEAVRFAEANFNRVRLMSFVPGALTGVDGFVLDDGVVVLRPHELVTFRHGSRIFWGGVSTYLEPPPAVRERMRRCARAVGEHLRSTVEYRGAFSVSGLLSDGVFFPFDCIARAYGGHRLLGSVVADLPMPLLNPAIMGGAALGISADQVERLLLEYADSNPKAYLILSVPDRLTGGARACWLRRDGSRLKPCPKTEASGGYVVYEALSDGGVLLQVLGPDAVKPGELLSELGASTMNLMTRRWSLQVDELAAISS